MHGQPPSMMVIPCARRTRQQLGRRFPSRAAMHPHLLDARSAHSRMVSPASAGLVPITTA
jgi:hypothetical protein